MSLSVSCVDTLNYDKSFHALKRTLETIGDKVDVVYWYSDFSLSEILGHKVEWIPIEKMNGQNDYSHVTLKVCPTVCECDFDLIVQWDGYACNRDAWIDEFFKYDYIGATWDDGVVGNGGFSLRSKRLYDKLKELNVRYLYSDFDESVVGKERWHTTDSYNVKFIPEDVVICRIYRNILENFGVKFAPHSISDRFSIENHSTISPWLNAPNQWIGKSFGFHGKYGIRSLYQ